MRFESANIRRGPRDLFDIILLFYLLLNILPISYPIYACPRVSLLYLSFHSFLLFVFYFFFNLLPFFSLFFLFSYSLSSLSLLFLFNLRLLHSPLSFLISRLLSLHLSFFYLSFPHLLCLYVTIALSLCPSISLSLSNSLSLLLSLSLYPSL